MWLGKTDQVFVVGLLAFLLLSTILSISLEHFSLEHSLFLIKSLPDRERNDNAPGTIIMNSDKSWLEYGLVVFTGARYRCWRRQVLLAFLIISSISVSVKADSIDSGIPYQPVYGHFYNNHFYLGAWDSFMVIPDTPNSAYLILYVLREGLKKLFSSSSMLWQAMSEPDRLRVVSGGLVDCTSHPVRIEHPELRRLLSIQTACTSDNEPVWLLFSSPVLKRSLPVTTDPSLQSRQLFRLWQLMDWLQLRFLVLKPQYLNKEQNSRQFYGVQLYSCNRDNHCFAIEVDAGSSNCDWLLSELTFHPFSPAFTKDSDTRLRSVFDEGVMKSVNNALTCYDEFTDDQQISCGGEGNLVKRGQGYWEYRNNTPVKAEQPWLYKGKYLRILPLTSCHKSEQKHHYQCPVYLHWAFDGVETPDIFQRPPPVLSIRFDQQVTDYHRQYFINDHRWVGMMEDSGNLAEDLFSLLLSSSTGISKPLLNTPLFSSSPMLLRRAEPVVPMKKTDIWLRDFMTPVSQPLVVEKGDYQFGGGAPAGGQQVQRGGRGDLLPQSQGHNGGSGAGGFGQPPPHPFIQPPQLWTIQHDLNNLLWQLQRYHLIANGLPVTSTWLMVIAETVDRNSNAMKLLLRRLKTSMTLRQGRIGLLLTAPPEAVYQHIMTQGFNPLDDNQLKLLAELLKEDIALFIANKPGFHYYHYYRRDSGVIVKGLVSASVSEIPLTTVFLAYAHDKGMVQLHPDPSVGGYIRSMLPDSVPRVISAYDQLSKEQGQGVETLYYLLTGHYNESAKTLLHIMRWRFARAGMLSFPGEAQEDESQLLYSKTLLENMEWFWSKNGKKLQKDVNIDFDVNRLREVVRARQHSSRLRCDRNLGEVAGKELQSSVFTNVALPAMTRLLDVQQHIAVMLMKVLGQISDGNAAIYGGAAIRSYLVEHAFRKNLDTALREGMATVNDIDVMVLNESIQTGVIKNLRTEIERRLPGIIIQEVLVPVTEHIHTIVLKICYEGTRLFSIDVSYSIRDGYYDFSDLEHRILPAFGGEEYGILLPMIGLKALLKNLLFEQRLTMNKTNERRIVRAQRHLSWFELGDQRAKLILASLLVELSEAELPVTPVPQTPDEGLHEEPEPEFEKVISEENLLEQARPESITASLYPLLQPATARIDNPSTTYLSVPFYSEQELIIIRGSHPYKPQLPFTPAVYQSSRKPRKGKKEYLDVRRNFQLERFLRINKKKKKERPLMMQESAGLVAPVHVSRPTDFQAELELKPVSTEFFNPQDASRAYEPITCLEDSPENKPKLERLFNTLPLQTVLTSEDYAYLLSGEEERLLTEGKELLSRTDLIPEEQDHFGLTGWASFAAVDGVYDQFGDYLLKSLQQMEGRVVYSSGQISVILRKDDLLKAYETGELHFQLPEIAWLMARSQVWNHDDGSLLCWLHRARYSPQALPDLVMLLANPDSRFFNPFILVKLAAEMRQAKYPDRYYRLIDAPVWPDLDQSQLTIMTLLQCSGDKQSGDKQSGDEQKVKEESIAFIEGMKNGYFHVGLGMVLWKLKGLSNDQEQWLISQLAMFYMDVPGVRWWLSVLYPDYFSRNEQIINALESGHVYHYWAMFIELAGAGSLPFIHMRRVFDIFNNSYEHQESEHRESEHEVRLPYQLMLLDGFINTHPEWINAQLWSIRRAEQTDAVLSDYKMLSNIMLAMYDSLKTNILFMPSRVRLHRFRTVARMRQALETEFSYGDVEDLSVIRTYLLRLVNAQIETGDDVYMRWIREFTRKDKDDANVDAILSQFYQQIAP